MEWEKLNVIEFKEALIKTKGVVIVRIGCLEKHGNHMPIGTDIMLAREISIMASKIEDVINSPEEIEERIVNLIQKANNLGGTDNISVAYLETEEEEKDFKELEKISNQIFDIILKNGGFKDEK